MMWPGRCWEEWLKNPKELADALGVDESELSKMTPEGINQIFFTTGLRIKKGNTTGERNGLVPEVLHRSDIRDIIPEE